MELPEDDVGIELMNARFRDMGILVETDDGYQVSPEFVSRMETAVEARVPDAEPDDAAYREAVTEELKGMGVPNGFEGILTNWVVHAIRKREWEE
ncbi:MAG: hypothetical protein KY455_07200 [Euryarchaeota archaeon]|nr:hypothetical protein [Euryarchaeota archaeon]